MHEISGTALQQTNARFQTTSLSALAELSSEDEAGRRKALDILISRYWPPVYAFLRHRGEDSENAAELTQAFFAEVVFKRKLFESVDKSRGKLKSLILVALRHFCIDCNRKQKSKVFAISLTQEQLQIEDAKMCHTNSGQNDQSFEKRWAMGILEETLRRCEAHYRNIGLERNWRLFEARVLLPAVNCVSPLPLAEIATNAGFDSPASAAAAIQSVKRRADILLREVVAETLADGEDLDAEVMEIRSLIVS